MERIKSEELPLAISSQLLSNENVYYFSFITFKGGCATPNSSQDHWIALTDKRVLYKSKVTDENNTGFKERDGIIPFDKISFMEIDKSVQNGGCGCSGTQSYNLKIASSGTMVVIPIPTEAKAYEIRKAYMELLELQKENKKDEPSE